MIARTAPRFRGTPSILLVVWIVVAPPAFAAEPAPETLQSVPPPVPPAPRADRMSDEHAGKDLDLSSLAHSPAGGSPYLGPAEALVVVNVFTDYQCPVCKRSADPVKQLAADFPGKVKVVLRNNALPMHARAEASAIAALAAGNQGKFWEYYDRLWAETSARDDASFERFARELGLDVERWKKDVADPETRARVRRESESAVKLGVPGTPGFFVNGQRQMGWGSYRDLRGRVEREIGAAASLVASGTAAKDVPAARIRATAEQNPKRDGDPAIQVDEWVKVLLAP